MIATYTKYDGLLIYSPRVNCASAVVGAGDPLGSQKDMFLPLKADELTGNYNVNDHCSGCGSTGVLKSQIKDTQSSPEKSGITFPALKFSFIFKVTEKFRSCHMNMQKSILVSNTGRIGHPFFCDSMGVSVCSIMSLYYRPSFNKYLSALQSLSSLKAGNSCFVL